MKDEKNVILGDELSRAETPLPEKSDEVTEPKRRGRRPGWRKVRENSDNVAKPDTVKPARKKHVEAHAPDSEYIVGMAARIQGLHAIMAIVSGLPELAISESEARSLAVAVDGVCVEFGIAVTGKVAAILSLLAAMGMIYVPRGLAVAERRRRAKQTGNLSVVDARNDETSVN